MTIDGAGTGADADAAIDVPGVRNVRDAGGVGALRRGVLYRSGALNELSADGARALARLGVRTVVDLRSTPEATDSPDLRHGLGFARVHAPVFAERRWPREQLELYPAMAEHAGRPAVTVLRRLLAADGPPVLVHCASGKDRTGVVVAVLQTLMGASEAEVVADFLRSNAALGLTAPPAPPTAPHGRLPVAAVHLRRALLWIRSHHGSVPAWLLAHGARESELTAARTLLTRA